MLFILNNQPQLIYFILHLRRECPAPDQFRDRVAATANLTRLLSYCNIAFSFLHRLARKITIVPVIPPPQGFFPVGLRRGVGEMTFITVGHERSSSQGKM